MEPLRADDEDSSLIEIEDWPIHAAMSHEEMEEIKRHFGVVAESLRSDIRQIAEGHDVIHRELQTQREELKEEFKEAKSLMRLSFSQLDQRTHTLKSDVSTLKSRVDRLESSQA